MCLLSAMYAIFDLKLINCSNLAQYDRAQYDRAASKNVHDSKHVHCQFLLPFAKGRAHLINRCFAIIPKLNENRQI